MGARPSYPALTAASPSAQALSSGTTSTSITFAAAAGGSGVYTYGAPSTSAGSVSGTAPGTVTLSGLTDGAVAVVSVLVTDTRTGQAITQRCTVSVATAAAPGDIAVTHPSGQALASGTTSASITFATPTGGSGSFTGALSLVHVVGSGASVGGTPSSASVSSLQDGDVVEVRCTWTDSGTGYTERASCVVAVASAAAPAEWSSTDYDFADITPGSTTAAGAFSIYRADGTTLLLSGAMRKETGTPSVTVSWDTSGVKLAMPSTAGSVLASAALDISALIPAGRGLDDGPMFIQMELDGLVYGASGTGTIGLLAGASTQATTPATGNVSGSLYATRLSAGTFQEQARRVSVGTATLGSAQDNSATVRTTQTLVLEIIGGRVQRLAWTNNGTGLLDVISGGSDVWDLGQAAVNPTSGRQRDITSGLHAWIAATVGSSATAAPEIRLKRLRVSTRTAPSSYP